LWARVLFILPAHHLLQVLGVARAVHLDLRGGAVDLVEVLGG
jgi:hypothetical protein